MTDHVGKVFLPGDKLENLNVSEKTSKAILGPGLRQEAEEIVVSKPGVLRHKEPNIYWIDSHQKRYVPVRSDSVIGVVSAKAGDVFRVDIGGSEMASLSYLSFEGATKRNRPDVKVGDLVYAKLLVANKDMEPELVCIDSAGRSSGLGVIGRDGGFLHSCSLNLTRKILSSDCPLLKQLGKSTHYEITTGMNGRLWVRARTVLLTITIINAIEASEFMSNQQIMAMCKRLADAFTEKD
ncbi:EXOS3-like protein [Mya arenaria]|uniref:Ribosomal RNA-processing protein 40 n=1 Tax=Mya arenaria TaxID=6604 RepID=A0ABY7FMI4_MYAAR|nr:exosome complex component RRP40-like [Mya arenaria]WAR23428.1 EXOS3-like protein [Mya arenaria]